MLLNSTRKVKTTIWVFLVALLVLVVSTVSADQWDENDEIEYRTWFAKAGCVGLFHKYTYFGRALVGSEEQLRVWKLDIREQLVGLHGLYNRRCTSQHRTLFSDCVSIMGSRKFLYRVLTKDDGQLDDFQDRDATLRTRRQEIRTRYAEKCEVLDFVEEPIGPTTEHE